MQRIPQEIRNAIRLGAFYLGNGTLLPQEGNILPDWDSDDYCDMLTEQPELMESFFAVFCNVLQIDEQNRVLNLDDAMRRTAEFIRQSVDQSYQPTVPFAEWELELA
jgi:hypothetical protein